METNKKLVTWNIRKTERFESKKRKIEALLNLFDKEQNPTTKPKKKPEETLEQSYKALKDELKKYVKKPEIEPAFHLNQHGLKAKIHFKKSVKTKKAVDPLFIEDIYQLLLRSIIGHQSPFPLSWAKLDQPQNVVKTVLLVIEGFTKSDVIENKSKLSSIGTILPHVIEIVSSNVPFASELSSLHQVTDFHIKDKGTYSTMFPKEKEVKIEIDTAPKPASKLHLLLSPIQMVMENYPFPQSVFQCSKSDKYVFSKDSYNPVTNESPLFAIDCEMCMTDIDKNELTRIAVINENLETVYHTFVKPHRKIINYITRFSGITPSMLADVTTRLSDVQKHLQAILPPDAILCGQSLNNDLHALQMIHPYVIDTSIIFNRSGIRGKKDSLKNLTFRHLNQSIQTDKKGGHSPIEDAIATMKLVQLKLQNGVKYGDACLEDPVRVKDESDVKIKKEETQDQNKEDVMATSAITANKDDGFFAKLSKNSKTTCLIGEGESLCHYNAELLNDSVQKFETTNRKKVLKGTLKHLEGFDFVVSHLVFEDSSTAESIEELNDAVEQLYEKCPVRTMFMVLLTEANKANYADIKSGLFMPVLKKVKCVEINEL